MSVLRIHLPARELRSSRGPVVETPFFFNVGPHEAFAVLHRAQHAPARHGVVLCAALAEEKLWSHRVYVNAARAFARQGFTTLRFDFRGEGESDLEFEETNLESRVADACRAAEVLLEHEPHLRGCFFLGHRLGSAVAAAAATRFGGRAQGLIAWDPVTSGRGYLMQLLRSVLASELAQTGTTATRASMLKRMDAGETVLVDGYGISPLLYRDLLALEWPNLIRAIRCPVLSINGNCEPAFWRETKQLHERAPTMGTRTMQWLEAQAA